jgi:hypothetical protein
MNEELKIIIAADVTDLQGGVKKAEESINGLGNAANKAKQPIANASYALTTMSGVVRDLPFGFIAIQNNLPLVVDSFSSLAKQSGGVGGALKGLGSALIGPAGIGFAFGAVTSIVTSLIQNYGSLGNAIDVIFSKNKEAAAATLAYNKELEKGQGTIGAEIATIDILVRKLSDLKVPYAERKAAYDQLKKVQPDILAGLERENVLSGNSIGLLLQNASARKELLKLKIQENAINKVLDENGAKLLKAENDLSIAINKEAAERKKLDELKKTSPEGSDKVRRQEIALSFLTTSTATARKEFDKLQVVQDSYIKKLDPAITKISEINSATQTQIENSKAEAEAKKTQTKANDDLAVSINKVAKAEAAKQAKQTAERNQQALIPNFGIEQAKPINPLATAGAVNPFVGSPIKESLLQEAAAAAAARTEYEKYAASVSGLVAPAIDNLFNALQNGTNVFEAIGQSVKALVVDIIKAIAKAAILKAITTAVSAGSGAGFFGGLFNLLGGGLGGVAAPTFGGGAGLGGGFALNGEVVFVQRGTDLVGVLNKGNSQINRVG